MSLDDRVRSALRTALEALVQAGELGPEGSRAVDDVGWYVERPKRAEHGDLATNVAMALAKAAGTSPRALAEKIVGALAESPVVASAAVAGPGFINVRLRPAALHEELAEILRQGRGYGRAAAATGERIDVEFVSANPTGPITVAAGRNAVFGDAVSRLLEARGHRVTREYYINDRGNQVRTFAESVRAVAAGLPVPEDGYHGAYVAELGQWLRTVDGNALSGDPETLGRQCVSWMLRGVPGSRTLPGIVGSLADLGVHFDVWFSEESLHRWGAVDAVIKRLEAGGHLVRKDGALFFRAPDGAIEDKDRVLQKGDGAWAYFASDVAYFADKIARGYDRLINVLGADHHGYVARVRNALTALGLREERFEALLYQLVYVTKGGQVVKMGKRAGNIVTVDEIMDEIDEAAGRKGAGADALRFFFLSRSANSNVEFDIDVAKKKSLDNPVFYVQYGYARLSSLAAKALAVGIDAPSRLSPQEWARLQHPDELRIAHTLADFPGVLAEAEGLREPHRIVYYVQDLARQFQSYFTRLKAESDTVVPPDSLRAQPGWEAHWDFAKTRARLAWIQAIRTVYGNALELLGISAPERLDRPAEDVVEDA
ncbi:MAG: arginine--tRNA ligase [Polyangiaceae bacterium]